MTPKRIFFVTPFGIILVIFCIYFTSLKPTSYTITKRLAIKDIDQTVLKFWKKRKKKILPWYKKQQKPDDVIISATPRFLLEPMLIALNIKHYILSEFDVKARQFIGPINVEGEKLRRFKKLYPNAVIDNFYTDSLRDTPLLLAAKNAFLVNKKYQVIPWNNKN